MNYVGSVSYMQDIVCQLHSIYRTQHVAAIPREIGLSIEYVEQQ
jgi:hypothetical protein